MFNDIDFDISTSGNDELHSLLFTRLKENYSSNKSLGTNQEIYKFNSYNYRSDEFIKEHDGLHILFMGCSVTMGIGLSIEEMWTTKLLNKIKETCKVSGNFNISKYGYSSYSCISAAFKYFKEIGKPDVIFYNIPNFSRAHKIIKNNKAAIQVLTKDDDIRVISEFNKSHVFTFFQTYQMLEAFCKINGIRLIAFSWDLSENDDLINSVQDLSSKYISTNDLFRSYYNFDTFYILKNKPLINYVVNQQAKRQLEFGITARDGAHYGELYQEYWADIIFDIYNGHIDFDKVSTK